MLLLGLKTLLFRNRAPDGLSYGATIITADHNTNGSNNDNDLSSTKAPGLEPVSRRSSDFSSATIVDIEAQDDGCSSRKHSQRGGGGDGFQVNARVISDATIGLSDGLTVPFALTAGLSALGNTRVVIFGGLAELMAGAISMGLGGYLGAKSEIASYHETLAQTASLAAHDPIGTEAAVRDVLAPFDLPRATLDSLATHLARSPRRVDFLMRFQHCAEAPAESRALTSALTIAIAYFLGGLIPLIPYFFVGGDEAGLYRALYVSVGVMGVALFVFGYAKTGMVVGWRGEERMAKCLFGGAQMVVVGGLAAGAAMGLVKASDSLIGG